MGFILGTVTIFNYGAGPAGIMRTLGKYMAGSAATFRCAIRSSKPRAVMLTETSIAFLWAWAVLLGQTHRLSCLKYGQDLNTRHLSIKDHIHELHEDKTGIKNEILSYRLASSTLTRTFVCPFAAVEQALCYSTLISTAKSASFIFVCPV